MTTTQIYFFEIYKRISVKNFVQPNHGIKLLLLFPAKFQFIFSIFFSIFVFPFLESHLELCIYLQLNQNTNDWIELIC